MKSSDLIKFGIAFAVPGITLWGLITSARGGQLQQVADWFYGYYYQRKEYVLIPLLIGSFIFASIVSKLKIVEPKKKTKRKEREYIVPLKASQLKKLGLWKF